MNGPEPGAMGEAGNPAKTPPLSIPAPVPRGDRPDADRETPNCRATVQFKVSLRTAVHLDCRQISSALGQAPSVVVTLAKGEIEATGAKALTLETECGSAGTWDSSELKLIGRATLGEGCDISLKAEVKNSDPEAENSSVTLTDLKNGETRPVPLQFP